MVAAGHAIASMLLAEANKPLGPPSLTQHTCTADCMIVLPRMGVDSTTLNTSLSPKNMAAVGAPSFHTHTCAQHSTAKAGRHSAL